MRSSVLDYEANLGNDTLVTHR